VSFLYSFVTKALPAVCGPLTVEGFALIGGPVMVLRRPCAQAGYRISDGWAGRH
jgi:hypothetical protein